MKTKEGRKRLMLLVLPVLMVPLLAVAFFALGGGGSVQAKNAAVNVR
jgi:nitrate reductase NapE component